MASHRLKRNRWTGRTGLINGILEAIAMTGDESFRDLIRRVRAGDEQAATELVRQYEPEIRREVRLRLTDPGLRRVIDSVDICQSVLGNFFARAALGQFDLGEPRQLLGLLIKMARNRLTDWARRQNAERRDQCRELSIDANTLRGQEPCAADPTPSQVVAGKELLEQVRVRMSDEERSIAERRVAGSDWAEIAAELGGTPEGLRKRLARAFDRVATELGL
jgi:RNA polymerase sigma factor (sigma-70 family)